MSNQIRNFCIIAHIDHGKSTLADRLLEQTDTIEKRVSKDRNMDTLDLEQERGITIKLQTARMIYKYDGELQEKGEYILNLIDTPGHVDFSYEVSRSVAACEGALLLIDVTQGIQAQTLSVMYKALEYDLKVIPVLNKVDLPNADTDRVKLEVMEMFGFEESEIILASGKTGIGVPAILDALVERVPAPLAGINESASEAIVSKEGSEVPRALIFDSFYHEYKGAVALVRLFSGNIDRNRPITFLGSKAEVKPVEVGYLYPAMRPADSIKSGEVGYIATGLRDIREVHVGDTVTVTSAAQKASPLMGYQPPRSMVFASLYPVDASDFTDFKEALERLSLNDAALTFQKETSQALGTGFLCGFLGLLHLEIIQARLEREFGIDLISTTPSVEYRVKLNTTDYSKLENINTSRIDEEGFLSTRMASEFPEQSLIKDVYEPWVKLEVFTPEEYIGQVMELCQANRGVYKSMEFTTKAEIATLKHAVIKYEIPSGEILVNFFDKLKSLTRGYASMDYEFIDHRAADIVKVSILINGEEAEALSFLCHRDSAQNRGKAIAEKLKDIIPRQQFQVPIQAAIGGKIIAREDIKAFRKDVTAKLYGGDETRKRKLLDKQKKGKKKMKEIGKVEIPKEAYLAALKIDQ